VKGDEVICSFDYGYLSKKPPKVAHNYDNPFQIAVDDIDTCKALCIDLGLTYTESGPSQWLYIKKHVEPHKDGYGSCLVYLYRGEGALYVLKHGKIHEKNMKPGSVVIFDDRLTHFWLSEKPCTILVCNVKEKYGDW